MAQVLWCARAAVDAAGEDARLTNVVFMGQGEPLANFERVWEAVEVLNSEEGFGLGARHMTISTSGIAPRIRELADRPLQVGLAVSLHAPDDALRDRLVPVNRRYPISELMAACRYYVDRTHRRVSFEYTLIAGVNDSDEQARQVVGLLRGFLGHVNLVPMNAVAGTEFQPPPDDRVLAFERLLQAAGIPCTVRFSRGREIDGACGQLRAHAAQEEPE